MLAPLDITVLRSGIPDRVPGRALNVCERGMAAILAGELAIGESVGVEFRLSSTGELLRTRALVRYQDKLRYGLEFTALSAEQRTAIRDWAKGLKATGDLKNTRTLPPNNKAQPGGAPRRMQSSFQGGAVQRGASVKRRREIAIAVAVVLLTVAAILLWRWNRSWDELESGLKTSEPASSEKPAAQVPPEVMERLLLHKVEPVYPAEARRQRLQGVIALNVVVGRDGSVIRLRPLNGPDILAQAAMDALRWWKFQPYRINGEPAVVETTLAVEFRR